MCVHKRQNCFVVLEVRIVACGSENGKEGDTTGASGYQESMFQDLAAGCAAVFTLVYFSIYVLYYSKYIYIYILIHFYF